MTNTVQLKRSSVANSVPGAGNLVSGELAINYTDGNLFYKNSSNVVTVIASNQFVSVTGNVTSGNINTTGNVSAAGTIQSGNVIYTNVDGTSGQVLTTYGNGQTYFSTVASGSGGNITVYLRTGSMQVQILNGNLTIVGRTGNILVPVSA